MAAWSVGNILTIQSQHHEAIQYLQRSVRAFEYCTTTITVDGYESLKWATVDLGRALMECGRYLDAEAHLRQYIAKERSGVMNHRFFGGRGGTDVVAMATAMMVSK